jgi:hypothetical protein
MGTLFNERKGKRVGNNLKIVAMMVIVILDDFTIWLDIITSILPKNLL